MHTIGYAPIGLSFLLLLSGPASAQGVAVFVDPSVQDVTVDDNVTVEIRLDTNGLEVGGGGVFLQFDNTRLHFLGGANDTATWDLAFFNVEPAEAQTGIVSLSVGSATGVNGSGVLISTLHFAADAEGDATLLFLSNPGREETVFVQPDLIIPYPTGLTGGSVTISGPAVSATPTETPTSTPTQATPGVTRTLTPTATPTSTPTRKAMGCVGDCNGDGRVTINELVEAVDFALADADPVDCPLIDSNQDGVVDVSELVAAVGSALQGCAQDVAASATGKRQ